MNKYIDIIERHVRTNSLECGEETFPLEYVLKTHPFPKDAMCIECGVASGMTINMIAHYIPYTNNIYGFDSFEGLPEEWSDGVKTYNKGAFTTHGNMPEVAPNVTLMKGWFHDTLPTFKQDILKDSPIALLHIDCDIYSSTKEVFETFKNNIVEGTIIVFDELWNYPDYRKHEMRAFAEFLFHNNKWFEPYVCRKRDIVLFKNKEVAVKIVNA